MVVHNQMRVKLVRESGAKNREWKKKEQGARMKSEF